MERDSTLYSHHLRSTIARPIRARRAPSFDGAPLRGREGQQREHLACRHACACPGEACSASLQNHDRPRRRLRDRFRIHARDLGERRHRPRDARRRRLPERAGQHRAVHDLRRHQHAPPRRASQRRQRLGVHHHVEHPLVRRPALELLGLYRERHLHRRARQRRRHGRGEGRPARRASRGEPRGHRALCGQLLESPRGPAAGL